MDAAPPRSGPPPRTRDAARTRQEILRGAAEAFAVKGYRGTTFDDLARGLSVSRSAIGWHFRSKRELLAALVTPVLDDYEQALDAGSDPRALLTSIAEVLLHHRAVVSWLQVDASAYSEPGPMDRAPALAVRARTLLAPTPDLAGELRAAAAIGALTRPLVALRDRDLAPHLAELVEAAHRTLRG